MNLRGSLCPICYKMKDGDTLHCIVCNCCVEQWDHHCHWLERCVNDYNLTLFHVINFIALCQIILNWILSLEGFAVFAFGKLSHVVYEEVFLISDSPSINLINVLFSSFFAFIVLSLIVIFGSLSYIIYMNYALRKETESKKEILIVKS